ncbi:tetra-peptide repeat homeobox protein 1-like [Anopheles ziemanni]|uniref:tetra-peptide repeat homeobox protein 1-like n=1 Tax=Anopheles coustani TaxID=139045 RepID=UPI00265971FE|nr:tetra-peptide repeat homeobox protein 1-like [Anopheles coustani]XP_058174190.1 tetra-peptide repeat homeobox protein 1-like [Anopheles ziemanni]
MKLLVLLVLPLALVHAGGDHDGSDAVITNQKQVNEQSVNQVPGTKKEKRGIFGFGAYAPAAPVYGHAFAHPSHHHFLPPADPLVPAAFAAPALPALAGPYLGAHAHTHTVVTKKVGIPIPAPYAVPVEKPYPVPVKVHVPVPVDRPYPVAVPRPYAVPVERPYPVPVDRPYPVAVPHPVPVPVIKHVGYPVPAPVPFAVPKPVPVPVHTPVVVEKPVLAAVGPDPWATAKLW